MENRTIKVNLVYSVIAVSLGFFLQGCFCTRFSPCVHVRLVTCDAYDNKARIIMESDKYYDEDPLSVLMFGEYSGKIPIRDNYIFFEFDANQAGKGAFIKKELFTITAEQKKNNEDISIDALVSGSDNLLMHPLYFGEIYRQTVFSLHEEKPVKQLVSDTPSGFFDISDDHSKIYYLNSSNLYFYDVNTGEEEILPSATYNLMKEVVNKKHEFLSSENKCYVTNQKYIFFVSGDKQRSPSGDYVEYSLINVSSGKVLRTLRLSNNEYVLKIGGTRDELYILTRNWKLMTVSIWNADGQLVGTLDLKIVQKMMKVTHDKEVFDGTCRKLYFIRYDPQNSNQRSAYGSLKVVVWDFINNSTTMFEHELSWADLK